MNTLALDTSTPILSIALETDQSYEERMVMGGVAHSEELLGIILSLLERPKLKLMDLDLLICTKGPGSFTGLRVGMSSLKGIALGSNAKLVSIPTLSVIEKATKYDGPIISVIDAKKNRFYFRLTLNNEVLVDDRDGNPEDIKEIVDSLNRDVLVTGPDASLFIEKSNGIFSSPLILDEEAPRNLSKTLIKLGKERLINVGPDSDGEGPVYIRRSDAEEMLRQKKEEQ